MALEGYRPAVQECAACGGGGPYRRFSAARGGALCERCSGGQESVLDRGTVALLAELLGGDLDRAARAEPPALPRREAGTLVKSFVEYHLDRRLRSYPLVAR
jgi:DNA repair protein RecO (recombination protein O)